MGAREAPFRVIAAALREGIRSGRYAPGTIIPTEQDLAHEFQVVSDWVHGLLERHGSRLRIDVLDAASIQGVLASVRHRVGRYPAVVLDGHDTWTGLDFSAVDAAIDRKVEFGGTLAGTKP